MRLKKRGLRDERGAALAEYGLLLAGVAMVCMLAVSVLGTKVGGLIGSVATMIPGTTIDLDAPVLVGTLLETQATDINGDQIKEINMPLDSVVDRNSATVREEGLSPRLGQGMGLDPHATSHAVQVGSGQNPFHAGGGN